MGSKIYPEFHKNPSAFFSSSRPILLEPLTYGSGDWSLPREYYITCKDCETIKEKQSKLHIEIETKANEKDTLLKNFQELENKLKDLQKILKELNELTIIKRKKERYDIWRECAQAHKLL